MLNWHTDNMTCCNHQWRMRVVFIGGAELVMCIWYLYKTSEYWGGCSPPSPPSSYAPDHAPSSSSFLCPSASLVMEALHKAIGYWSVLRRQSHGGMMQACISSLPIISRESQDFGPVG